MDRCPNHIGHLHASLKIWSNRIGAAGGGELAAIALGAIGIIDRGAEDRIEVARMVGAAWPGRHRGHGEPVKAPIRGVSSILRARRSFASGNAASMCPRSAAITTA